MNNRPIIGNKDNLKLLGDLAAEFLPMVASDSISCRGNVKAVKMRVHHFITVQRDMKQVLRRGVGVLKPEGLAWAVKQKADAAFDENRLRGDLENHMVGYRQTRKMEFLLKSIILMANAAEASDVSSNA